MPDQLVVITGAGASKDSTRAFPCNEYYRPPLVTELFAERQPFVEILRQYPDAQSLAPDLRAATRSGSVGLETYLRDHVLESGSDYDQRRYRSIPLYLQHVLFEVSSNFTSHPVNYDRLVNAALRSANEVLFVTLNYDTLLDQRLSLHTPITSLGGYVNPHAPWSLIKLHGSVNWMKEIAPSAGLPRADQLLTTVAARISPEMLSDEILFSLGPGIQEMRNSFDGRYFYPALSVPLGPEDEVNCPPFHLNQLLDRLGAHDGLHIVTIGYSGLDSGLLSLLRDSQNDLRSLLVINHSGAAAYEAAERIAWAFDTEPQPEMAAPQDFDAFVAGDELAAYLDAL